MRWPALRWTCAGIFLRWRCAGASQRWRWAALGSCCAGAALALGCAGAGPRWNHSIPIAHRRELLPAATACIVSCVFPSLCVAWHRFTRQAPPTAGCAPRSRLARTQLNSNTTQFVPVSESWNLTCRSHNHKFPPASSTLAQRSPVAGGCAGIVLRCALGCAGGSALGLRWRWAALALACAVRWAALGILRWGCAGAGAALALACAGAELRWGNLR